MRIDPAPSVPRFNGAMPAAQAAAAPALLPPGVRSGFHGLRVMPVNGLSPIAFQPNSGVVVLPRMIAPVSRSRAVAGASSASGTGSTRCEPRRVGKPRIKMRSLIVTGTPSSGPCGARGRHRAVPIDDAEGVELRLQLVEAGEQSLRSLDRRQFLFPVKLDQLLR